MDCHRRHRAAFQLNQMGVVIQNQLKSLLWTVLAVSLVVEASPQKFTDPYIVKVNKCCEKFEVIFESRCTDARKLNNGTATFEPVFTSVETGEMNINVADYKFIIGKPDCGSLQVWPIYQYPSVKFKKKLKIKN